MCVLMQLKWQFHRLPGSNVCSGAIEMAIFNRLPGNNVCSGAIEMAIS